MEVSIAGISDERIAGVPRGVALLISATVSGLCVFLLAALSYSRSHRSKDHGIPESIYKMSL